jgi:DNA polymerase-3 subunit epsilon
MKLNLIRPLAFFDLETTGITVGADRIVEIAILKILPSGDEELLLKRINPKVPIPLESSLIHGIYDKDIQNEPTFEEIAAEIADFIGDADLAGYNSNKFDIPLLLDEFLRVNVDFDMANRKFVDVQNIFHQMEQRTLKAAYKFYCQKDLINAHSAEADIRATYEVLLAQLEKYENTSFEDKQGNVSTPVKNDVGALHQFTNLNKNVDYAGRIVLNDKGQETINFGKHKGRSLDEIFKTEPSYYAWMMQGDFPRFTKKILENAWKSWNQRKEAAKQQNQSSIAERSENKNRSQPKNSEPAKPMTNDMLSQLQAKFGKQ